MSFSEFKGIWWVMATGPDGKAPVGEDAGDGIAIGGIPSAVKIICATLKGHYFNIGAYQEHPEQINVTDETGDAYKITLERNATNNKIICGPASEGPAGPGSWTAEDNPGGIYQPKPKKTDK